jgi:hypothetical protein
VLRGIRKNVLALEKTNLGPTHNEVDLIRLDLPQHIEHEILTGNTNVAPLTYTFIMKTAVQKVIIK